MSVSKEYYTAYNREYYLKNRERIIARSKAYSEANREQVRAKGRQRALRDKEKNNERAKQWYLANKELMKARAVAWKKANPDKVRANTRDYATRKRKALGSFSTKDYIKLLNRYLGLCAYCGVNKANSIDHVLPLSRGGTNYIGNILPACGSCNYSKGPRTLVEWRYGKKLCTREVAKLYG
jgi:5-methylcytosine-specific restriction endonuclease McrA